MKKVLMWREYLSPGAAKSASRHARREYALLAVEAGAILLFLVTAVALLQTQQELNEAYRRLQHSRLQSSSLQNQRLQQDSAQTLNGLDTPRRGRTAVMTRRIRESDQAQRLQIAAIGVDSLIFQEYSEENLKWGAVQVGPPVFPGQPGNLVLAAHNNIYGEIFRDLDELQPGDDVRVLANDRDYTYRVRETMVVEPDDVWVTLPTATPTLTLVSCYPYLIGDQRIIVFADYVP